MILKLFRKIRLAVRRFLERNISKLHEEIVVIYDTHVFDRIKVLLLHMLLKTRRCSAGFSCHIGVEKIIPALKRTLHQASCVVAGSRRQIICRHIR